ncbi:MAG: hypothetical protein AB7Q97_09330 [Gammaproteobacteria bacterium]
MSEAMQRALQMLVRLFIEMPPLAFAVAGAVLLGLALWASCATWHSHRVLDAIANAPVVDLRSTAAGWVKLRGTAHPLPAKPGSVASGIVWYKRDRWTGGDRSTLVTTDPILVRDDYGICAVDSEKADVRPTTHETSHAFLDRSRSTTEQVIRAGDPVFAIGELRRAQSSLPGAAGIHCELTRTGGVLLVSGSPERNVQVYFRLLLLVQLPLALMCIVLMTFGALIHVGSYPPGGGSAVGTFIASLRNTPLQGDPGIGHPLWRQVETGQGGGVMNFLGPLLNTHGPDPTIAEASRKLAGIGPSFGLQLAAPPIADYAAQGWEMVNAGGISMFVPSGWTVVEQDDGAVPVVGVVAPGNDLYVELRFIRDALRRPGIVLEDAIDAYASAKERGAKGVVLGYAPLFVDGAVGHVEIMNAGGVERNPDGSRAHRTNSYRGAKRVGDEVFKAEFRATFDQSNQDEFGPTVLNIIRSIRFPNIDAAGAAGG